MENSFFERIDKTLDDVRQVLFEYKYSNKSTLLFFTHGVKKTNKAYLKLIRLHLELAIDYIDHCLKFYD